MTHTFAELELSQSAYDEIARKMREAGYDHALDGVAIDMKGIGVTRSAVADEPDWFWRTMDPDDAGENPDNAMTCTDFFKVDEIASSYVGPTRYYFKAPCLDPNSDDEDCLGFDTEAEAEAAILERKAALVKVGKIDAAA